MRSKKLECFRQMDRLELNHHHTESVTSLEVADFLAEKFEYRFSIRTDRNYGITKDLPFFLIDEKRQYFLIRKNLQELLNMDFILIFSDGHHYDPYLKYNLVFYMNYDGNFQAEYSAKNVPLRHMYRYPDTLVQVTGNINERYPDWDIRNRQVAEIDFRQIRDTIYLQYMRAEKLQLYRRHLEMSVYTVPCGVRHEEIAYWEI